MTDNHKLSFAIKNTNWCNLQCAHCCECSSPKVAPNIMPLANVEKYIGEFRAMPLPKWDYIVFTGGETMAPYYHNQVEYIPQCLDIAAQNNMSPFLKTNGMWGADENLRTRILRDVAHAAHKNNTHVSLDISVDEFHNNLRGVYNIINNVVRSDYMAPAIRISLAGLNTQKSRFTFANLIAALRESGLNIQVQRDGNFVVSVPLIGNVNIYYDMWANVSNSGRAKDNKLGKYEPDGQPDAVMGSCLQIDNNDIATLNYKYTEPVNGRNLHDVAIKLLGKMR